MCEDKTFIETDAERSSVASKKKDVIVGIPDMFPSPCVDPSSAKLFETLEIKTPE